MGPFQPSRRLQQPMKLGTLWVGASRSAVSQATAYETGTCDMAAGQGVQQRGSSRYRSLNGDLCVVFRCTRREQAPKRLSMGRCGG